jgi:predicted dithiol-disulfide oxidoreductase (DUF899 family)
LSFKNEITSRDEWIKARIALLDKEKELTQLRDEVNAARRAMPWVEVDTDYVFEGPDGSRTLSDLFEDKSQLIVYHFMYGEDWEEGCKSCSFWADQYDRINLHIGQRDVSIAAISRAPWQQFAGFKDRMGWQFRWLSSAGNSFNEDYHVSFSNPGQGYYNYRESGVGQEMPGLSVFYKDDSGKIYHTYSCYSRGLDPLNPTYQMLDLVPKGRDESDLPYPMAWVNLHDRY